MPSFSFTSDLPVRPEVVLANLTLDGMNNEFSPIVRMTAPDPYSGRSILQWPEQQELFKSWILLFGCLPVDRHAFYFEAIDCNEGFSERSESWVNKYWRHERKVISRNTGCRVTDTVHYKSRIPFLDVLLKPIYQLVFCRRHSNLQRKYVAGRN